MDQGRNFQEKLTTADVCLCNMGRTGGKTPDICENKRNEIGGVLNGLVVLLTVNILINWKIIGFVF